MLEEEIYNADSQVTSTMHNTQHAAGPLTGNFPAHRPIPQ